jgi:DNA polymerase-3 subunit epsilon/ATP-dependent DNA helicase DinG
MRGELVAIDLETTGFDPEQDAIIEVGAVRLRDGEILEEYGSLINPGRPIPANITHLTGIRTEDVLGAPGIAQVLPAIRTFVGNAPVIGHNVGFDLGFLNKQGILANNLRIDTYDLVTVLLPRAPRYSLASLASDINIDLENAHRALDDARAAALLYWMLWQKILALPYETLYEIVQAAQGFDWTARWVFEAALREYPAQQPPPSPTDQTLIDLFGPAQFDSTALNPHTPPDKLDVEAVKAMFGPDGKLAQRLGAYEYRPQQVKMAGAVAESFNAPHHIMIEAGTGTGKSLAYLVPAILWASLNDERVVVSTNTINLQEQLMTKDIPLVSTALDEPFRAAVMKGRGNYLCPRRLAVVRRRRPSHIDELRTVAKVLVWLLESNTGDKGEISLRGPVENETWNRLSAEDEGCSLDRCQAAMQGACPFYKARKAADAAHLLVVNHALLLSDAAAENRVLPEYNYLVLDEAHHLEEAVTNGMSFRMDEAALRRRLADLGGVNRGLLGDLLRSVQGRIPEREAKRLETFARNVSGATDAMQVHIQSLFQALRDLYQEAANANRSGDFIAQVRVTPELRTQDGFNHAQAAYATLREFFEVISDAMRRLAELLNRMEEYHIPGYGDLVSSANATARYLAEANAQLKAFMEAPDPNTIYWLNAGQNIAYLAIHAAPLHVGPLAEKYLWRSKAAVISTSATLQTNGDFTFIRDRLSAESVETLDVGSPFDYKQSTLIFIPNDMPEPTERHQYQQFLERGLVELAAALNGRVLGLFTSYTQLRQTAQAIGPRLQLGNITVYDQSDGSSRQALLEGFKSTERAVLLGTKSFWEGVDIPGESLSALVITRLPFAVPTEPIFAARSETYTDSFKNYAVPDAILRFRQGFGRLIRSRSDRGVVAIFDRRIMSKGYGAQFLEALPDCTVQYGPLSGLPAAAKEWLSNKS